MLSNKYTECSQCGMVVKSGEYHPYAACLMFMACKDGATVRANLEFVLKQDTELIRQMLEAMEGVKALNMGGELALWTAEFDRLLSAITAGRARLEGKP